MSAAGEQRERNRCWWDSQLTFHTEDILNLWSQKVPEGWTVFPQINEKLICFAFWEKSVVLLKIADQFPFEMLFHCIRLHFRHSSDFSGLKPSTRSENFMNWHPCWMLHDLMFTDYFWVTVFKVRFQQVLFKNTKIKTKFTNFTHIHLQINIWRKSITSDKVILHFFKPLCQQF